jgi:UDP:flavonoid glycosyltransferase YjiC (YdhE family)
MSTTSSSSDKTVLILAEGGTLAHPTRCAELARLVLQAGANVVYGTSAEYLPYIGDIPGARKLTISSPPTAEVLRRLDAGKFFVTTEELHAQHLENVRLIRDIRPVAVIGDARMALPASCAQTRVPCLTLVNHHWSPYVASSYPIPDSAPARLFGPRLAGLFSGWVTPHLLLRAIQPLNDFRQAQGLLQYGSMREALCDGDYVLYVGLPEQALPSFPSNHLMIGPLIWKHGLPPGIGESDISNTSNPIIVASLGSSGDQGLMPKIARALRAWPGTLIASHPQPQTVMEARPERTIVRPLIPIVQALRSADLLIGNGGTATILASLAAGKPYLALYTNLDQALSFEQYSKTGAVAGGLSSAMTERSIREAVSNILGNSVATDSARACRDAWQRAGGDQWSVEQIRRLLNGLRPPTDQPSSAM